ncbi:hypothetical protein AKJ50_01195 [candidate division MSBL1 archaeon SCGC-AAA382A13]|uniref:Uncharacterized protein n=1 Tax=candidate division MSBL1 archaeon SCGC-AAA382A13 TaxID=1698279 RepID=A0A133VFX7_9EURY|nr:hypothetical protein AKJ50_01195 [candidate division MSBL1 archaeon SCGC-AAA382A13]
MCDSSYNVEPVFEEDTIIYSELKAEHIKLMKSMFDALGHYQRWDLVNLNINKKPYEPIETQSEKNSQEVSNKKIKQIAEKHTVEKDKLEKILQELTGEN